MTFLMKTSIMAFSTLLLSTFASQSEEKDPENPIVLIKTNMGDIKLELFQAKAPKTVKNFLDYVKDKAYEGTTFHRVIDGFMIQGGGLTPDLESIDTLSPIKNEAANGLKNDKGTVAMARTNEINSATSQFFINLEDNDFLNHKSKKSHEFGYAVFGKVIEGIDVVEKIGKVKTVTKGYYRDVPEKDIIIEEVSLI